MFKCAVCSEKDLRITDLKAQIADLKRMIIPPPAPAGFVSDMALEQDAILSGRDEVFPPLPPLPTPLAEESLESISERDRLLAGNYENATY